MRVHRASLAAACVLLAGSVHAQVRLSQIYGGGGNVGAPYLSDYVELHNAGAPQSLAGWSIQYATAGGSSWSVTPLPALTLATGQYLLVRQSEGTSLLVGQALALPAPDASAAGAGVAMNTTDAKVALCSTTSALTGSQPTSAAIVDFVGYGALASWREPFSGGTAADNAPSPSTALALFRRGCGASDANDNNSDWAVGTPSPRNRATALANGISALGLATPYFAEPLQSVRLCVTPFACANAAPVANANVTLDASAIGGSSSLALLDDGTLGDEVAGDGLYSRSVALAAGTGGTTQQLPFVVTSGVQSGGGSLALVVAPAVTPDNDSCANATVLSGPLPLAVSGDFLNANVEFNPLLAVAAPNTPSNGQGARRGLWFSVTGTGGTLLADTCASPVIGTSTIPDTVLGVFAGSCDGLTLIGLNDDNPSVCGAGMGVERRSRVSWCSELGATYYVWIASFATGPTSTAYTLTVSAAGSCSGVVPAGVCAPAIPPGAVFENEAGFGPAANDGCESSPLRFHDIRPGSPALVVRGSSRSYSDRRDADWYRFRAPVAGLLRVSCTFASQGTLELRRLSATGSCTTNTLIDAASAERCAGATLSALVGVNEWYAVRIASFNSAPTTQGGIALGARSAYYRAEFELGGAPPNDACANAAALALDGVYVTGSTLGATNDGGSACDPSGTDVWYSIQTGQPGRLELDTCGSSSQTVVSVYSGCGGSLLACNDDCATPGCVAPNSCLAVSGLAAGTYRIRISSAGAPGSFRVRAQLAIENDDCAGAVPLACNGTVPGSTIGATTESGIPGTCPGPGAATHGGSFSVTAPGVWYAFVLPGVPGVDDRTVYVDTLTASFDTRLTVFSGPCGALTCVTANDDVVGAPLYRSKVGWRAVAGATYYLLVHGFGSATGTFVVHARCELTPANDDCADAQAIGPYAGSRAGTTVGATGEPYAFATGGGGGMASCAAVNGEPSTFSYFDVWYEFAALCDAHVTFETCGAFDTVLSVHATCPSASASNALGNLCNDDGDAGCAPGSSLDFPLYYGNTYWLRVAQADASQPGGAFTLRWTFADTDGDGSDDCVDDCPHDPNKSSPGFCGCGISDLDSDGDGVPDCADLCPTDPNKLAPGQCGCGNPDLDSDGDGAADCVDGCPTDPLKLTPGACGCGSPDIDSDGDGTLDCFDGCPLDPNKLTPGICGCGEPDVDSDGDGTLDCFDGCPLDPNKLAPGVCGCGFADLDSDSDGTPDCIDGCPSDPAKIAPGACGCGIADLDADGDGVADCIDNCDALANPGQADCDSDGIGDACEIAFGQAFDTNANAVPDECEHGLAVAYCTAGTSTNGCLPSMSSTGTPSAAASQGFELVASSVEGQRSAIFFYGINGPLADAWGTSTSYLCVKAPTQRTLALNSGGSANSCSGSVRLDWLAWIASDPNALGSPFSAGELVWAQLWYRDPLGIKTTELSNGLQFTLAP